MPDEMVEKVARAIYEARGAHEPPRAWRKWEGIGDEARAVWCQCATAALSAAHAEPVADERRHCNHCAARFLTVWERCQHEREAHTSYPSEAAIRADERDLLAEMGKHTNWELSYSGGWTDDPAVWTVHEVTGGRSDRVWTEIGSGATPAEAIATAIRARGEAPPNAKRPDPA